METKITFMKDDRTIDFMVFPDGQRARWEAKQAVHEGVVLAAIGTTADGKQAFAFGDKADRAAIREAIREAEPEETEKTEAVEVTYWLVSMAQKSHYFAHADIAAPTLEECDAKAVGWAQAPEAGADWIDREYAETMKSGYYLVREDPDNVFEEVCVRYWDADGECREYTGGTPWSC